MNEKVEGGGGEWDKLKDRIFAKDKPHQPFGFGG